jgi:hypothetical protein
MPNQKKLYSWQEFKTEIAHLRQNTEGISKFLFRGHGSDRWLLETTLERSDHDENVLSYYRLALRIKPEIQAFTDGDWPDSPEVPSLMNMVSEYDTFSLNFSTGALPHYAYLAHLRHHGFPSPLLDWSSSPFVAAFFAFQHKPSDDGNVAIYAYRERGPHNMKTGGSDKASIRQLGPYVSGPKRHFAQRSQYTICTHWNNGSPIFSPHYDVCQPFDPKAEFQQDMIYKFLLSSNERHAVLTDLAEYNMNAFTLFGSEESLMQALSQKEEIELSADQ